MNQSSPKLSLKSWFLGYFLSGCGVLILISIGCYGMLIRPLQLSISDNQQKIEQSHKFVLCVDALQERNRNLTHKHAEISQAVQVQLDRLPATSQEAEFLSWTSSNARDLGLELRDFRPSGATKYGDLEGLPIRLHATGTYSTICNFLKALSDGPRMTRVMSIELVPVDNARTSFQVTLQLVVFYQPPKTPVSQTGEKTHV